MSHSSHGRTDEHGPHGEPSAHGGHAAHGEHSVHGNPTDLDGYIAKMEDPARGEWQKPDEVIAALHLAPGQSVCDVGAGPGYFSLRLARAVTATGHVWAVDVEPRMLVALRERALAAGTHNLTPVLAAEDDPLLPPASCDLVLVVDTFHHFPDGVAYLRKLRALLRKGGRIANIDFHKRELPVGPAVDHKVSREDFLTAAVAAGLQLVDEKTFLPHQYFLLLAPR